MEPTLFSTGVETVVVNGKVEIDGGQVTGVAGGRALPHTPTAGTCA